MFFLPTEVPDRHWRDFAACRGLDTEMFFPGRGMSTGDAKAVCATCDVRYPCLIENLREQQGIWGGTSDRERRVYKRYLVQHRRLHPELYPVAQNDPPGFRVRGVASHRWPA